MVRLLFFIQLDFRVMSLLLVPIYDGTKYQLDPNKHLSQLSNLPLWKDGDEEAPKRCAAVVGYTVNTYTSHQVRQLSLNIQWLIVLGVTDDN
jgi:hypothetical protein